VSTLLAQGYTAEFAGDTAYLPSSAAGRLVEVTVEATSAAAAGPVRGAGRRPL
jgi:hypothetical protein